MQVLQRQDTVLQAVAGLAYTVESHIPAVWKDWGPSIAALALHLWGP